MTAPHLLGAASGVVHFGPETLNPLSVHPSDPGLEVEAEQPLAQFYVIRDMHLANEESQIVDVELGKLFPPSIMKIGDELTGDVISTDASLDSLRALQCASESKVGVDEPSRHVSLL